MPQQSQFENRSSEQRRILLITEDPVLRVLISGFLVTMGCACAMVSTREMDAIIERETFDAVLLDVFHSRLSFAQALHKINKSRPRLSKRMLPIRRSLTDRESVELMDAADPKQVARTIQMSQLWAILQERFKSSDSARLLPRRMRLARIVFDNRSTQVTGVRAARVDCRRLAYQHKDSSIDLLIEPVEASGKMSVTGQLLQGGNKHRATDGVPVLLVSGSRTVARTNTNAFGEFRFECEPVEDGCIEMRLGEGQWISLQFGRIAWDNPKPAELEEKG